MKLEKLTQSQSELAFLVNRSLGARPSNDISI